MPDIRRTQAGHASLSLPAATHPVCCICLCQRCAGDGDALPGEKERKRQGHASLLPWGGGGGGGGGDGSCQARAARPARTSSISASGVMLVLAPLTDRDGLEGSAELGWRA